MAFGNEQQHCGCFYVSSGPSAFRRFLPQVKLSSHTTILSTTSRTVLTQTFVNPSKTENLEQVRYIFPLYDGVGVVGFKCTVAGRVLVGVVKEKQQAHKDYKAAVDRGETAGLLDQFSNVGDCFLTRVGNVPANEKVIVEITHLGELKHDAETEGVRFTIPTVIAPRYGPAAADSGELRQNASSATDEDGIRIVVDIAVEDGVAIRGVQSPTHPIALMMGRTSSMPEEAFDNQHASATLTSGRTQLDKDFILVVTSQGHDTPRALLETHPTIPHQRALMATLVPKFSLPKIHPEIVFIADRSGSMDGKIHVLVSALKIFLKSLPLGTKFNLCSFGSHHEFLWPKSKAYDESSLTTALRYVESFDASFGGTAMLNAVENTIKNRYKDMQLEVILATDGQIWNQEELFSLINEATTHSVRFFSLGIGDGASSSLVEGIARAGDGFAQFAGENETIDKRVVTMLKGALTPHVKDYTLSVKYEEADEEYETVESVQESLESFDTNLGKPESKIRKKVVSLFDESAKVDDDIDKAAEKDVPLPHISTPKLLQAPHKISCLHPFHRTTVYLLMSPESCQHKPRAILLRATSEHGPLELEIPVQDVGTGQTLHQLGVKKALQELEEGRGWVTEAIDGDGNLFKAKYESRWDELVEREAVHLSVSFQVGSKWCAFIAIDENANKSETVRDNVGGMIGEVAVPVPLVTSGMLTFAPPAGMNLSFGMDFRLSSSFSALQPTVTAQLFSAAMPSSDVHCSHATPRKDSGEDLVEFSDGDMEMPLGESSARDDKAASLPQTDEGKMHELISLQAFDGSWQWTEGLFKVLEVEEHKLRAALTGLEEAVMATLIAVAFLEHRMATAKGVWEMVVEKAEAWLARQIGESTSVDSLAKVKQDVLGVARE